MQEHQLPGDDHPIHRSRQPDPPPPGARSVGPWRPSGSDVSVAVVPGAADTNWRSPASHQPITRPRSAMARTAIGGGDDHLDDRHDGFDASQEDSPRRSRSGGEGSEPGRPARPARERPLQTLTIDHQRSDDAMAMTTVGVDPAGRTGSGPRRSAEQLPASGNQDPGGGVRLRFSSKVLRLSDKLEWPAAAGRDDRQRDESGSRHPRSPNAGTDTTTPHKQARPPRRATPPPGLGGACRFDRRPR